MRSVWALVAALALFLSLAACGEDGDSGGDSEGGGGSIRVALGDIESVETLALFIAMERVRKRGTDVEVIELADEDLANQAVVGGQADVGLGAPYGLIQGSGAPLRIVCQLQRIRFFPVVDKAAYPDWQSLDGETFGVHSRGSTSEALARIIEEEEGKLRRDRLRAGRRGARDRAAAREPQGRHARHSDPELRDVRGAGQIPFPPDARDRASADIFGNTAWMEENQESVQVLLEEILKVWQSMVENPEFVVEERERLGPLPDLPAELEKELLPYYEQAAEEGLFTEDCGGEPAAKEDFVFYGEAGQLEGDPGTSTSRTSGPSSRSRAR